MRHALPILVFLSALACDDAPRDKADAGPPPECAALTETPRVTIGTGEDATAHVAIAPDEPLPIVPGLQGGHHIWGSFRFVGLLPDDINLVFELLDGDRKVGGADYIDDVGRGPSGDFEYGAVTVFIYNEVGAQALDGHVLTMRVTLYDQCGRSATDAARFEARCCAADDP